MVDIEISKVSPKFQSASKRFQIVFLGGSGNESNNPERHAIVRQDTPTLQISSKGTFQSVKPRSTRIRKAADACTQGSGKV